MPIAVTLLAVAAAAAAASDVRSGRIPNALVLPLAVAMLALDCTRGPLALAEGVAILAVVLAAGTLAFARGWLGGGDVKFIAAGAAGLSSAHAADFILYTLVAGGALALVAAARKRRLVDHLGAATLIARGHSVALGEIRLPYAVAILAGALTLALALTTSPALLVLR